MLDKWGGAPHAQLGGKAGKRPARALGRKRDIVGKRLAKRSEAKNRPARGNQEGSGKRESGNHK